MTGPQLLSYFRMAASTPAVVAYKFVASNQMLFFYIRDPGPSAQLHELHIHYAALRNGIVTGANLRRKGACAANGIVVGIGHPIIAKCLQQFRPPSFHSNVYSNGPVRYW